MIYFTSDLHFNHVNILKYQAHTRPYKDLDEMNNAIINKWNSIVTQEDTVYLLGDVCMGERRKAPWLINRLKAKEIHLIRGNHDTFSTEEEKQLFSSAQDYLELKVKDKGYFVLFHYPISEWDRGHRGSIHLHGHCHGNLREKVPNRFDIGWDVFGEPVSIDRLAKMRSNKVIKHH